MMTTTLLKALAQRRGFRGREDGWNECSEERERERERETKITGVERRGEEGRGGRTSLCKRSVGVELCRDKNGATKNEVHSDCVGRGTAQTAITYVPQVESLT